MRVLVTGAAGYVASMLLPAFRDRFALTLADARSSDRDGVPVRVETAQGAPDSIECSAGRA